MNRTFPHLRGTTLTIALVAVVAAIVIITVFAVMMIQPDAPAPGVEPTDSAEIDSPPAALEPDPASVEDPPDPPEVSDGPDKSAAARPGAYIAPIGRSPIPLPGETFNRPLPYRKLEDAAVQNYLTTGPAPESAIPWHQAPRFIGQAVVIEGEIVNTHNTGSVCFLNFTENWQGQFYLIVFNEVIDAFPEPPEEYFLNHKVRVKGVVKTHRNRPQIQIRRVDQIEIID